MVPDKCSNARLPLLRGGELCVDEGTRPEFKMRGVEWVADDRAMVASDQSHCPKGQTCHHTTMKIIQIILLIQEKFWFIFFLFYFCFVLKNADEKNCWVVEYERTSVLKRRWPAANKRLIGQDARQLCKGSQPSETLF